MTEATIEKPKLGRKLASIQQISALEPIEGSDNILKARVLGWQLVTNKENGFSVGDKVIYLEVDSLCPEKPEFEFLRPRGFRIRTIKLRGQVSQGLIMPLSLLPEGEYNEGDDVTDLLGVVKYEPPIPANLAGQVKGAFPGFIPKTDEIRVQTLQDVLDRHQGTLCYKTEKLDGSSMTVYHNDGEFGVCSRNLDLKETPENLLWQVARKLDLETKLAALGGFLGLQGEIIGPGIQGNKYGLKQHEFRVFNIYNIREGAFLSFVDFVALAKTLGLETVPVLDDSYVLGNNIDTIVKESEGNSVLAPNVKREGFVIRPLVETPDPELGRLSLKAINPQFLLKYQDD